MVGYRHGMAALPDHSTARAPLVRGLIELTLETDDVAALEHFYRELLGLELLSREDDRVWLAIDDRARLGLWSPGPKEFGDRGGRHVHFAFAAQQGALDALAQRLRAAGHDVRGPLEHDGGDRSLYVRDPAGNLIEAWDLLDQPSGRRDGIRSAT